jgi:hypothetical protein
MKKLLLIQPGGLGDLFLCAPIAKFYYDQEYQVDWPVREDLVKELDGFWYANVIPIKYEGKFDDWLMECSIKAYEFQNTNSYDKILNLSDRFPIRYQQRTDENFELYKYRIAEVPFRFKHSLTFVRNGEKEYQLMKKIIADKPYALVHRKDSLGDIAEMPKTELPIIEIEPITGFSIKDWYLIMTLAKEIYVVESAVHQFLDGIKNIITKDCYLLRRKASPEGTRFTVSSDWKLDYIGKDSIIKG